MNSVKLNKKHLFSFLITLVLLFSLNLNTFASSFLTINFSNENYSVFNVSNSYSEITSNCVVSNGNYNNLHYTKYSLTSYNFSKWYVIQVPFEIYYDTNYEYTFYSESSLDGYRLKFEIVFYNSSFDTIDTLVIFDSEFSRNSSGSSGSYVVNKHSGSLKISPINGTDHICGFIHVYDDNDTSYLQNFYLYDFVLTSNSPLYGEPITPADTDGLTSIMGDYDNTVNQLPSIKDYDTETLFDVNLDSYTSAMNFVKDMFDNFIALSGLNSVLLFALCIGLATYIVGRKVG